MFLGDCSLGMYRSLSSGPGGSAWDISTAVYSNNSYSVGPQDASAWPVSFSSNGTKMYIGGQTNDTVYQYSLSSAWDISTAAYASKSFSVSGQETTIRGMSFSSDGAKMYICGTVNDTIYQYTLSSSWDVSTASYDSKSFSVSSQDTTPSGMVVSSDGTKIYVIGDTNDVVYQYALSTPYDVSTASYSGSSFSTTSEQTASRGLFISSDGTRMYVSGAGATPRIYQYSLSVAFDITSASYTSKSLSISSQDGNPRGIYLSDDGTDLFVVGFTNNKVYQYTM